MNKKLKQKTLIWKAWRSCSAFILALAFLTNSFLPAFSYTRNSFIQNNKLDFKDLSYIAYAYKSVLDEDIPSNTEIFEVANTINSNKEDINIETSEKFLQEKVKNNINIKSDLIEKAYENKYQKDLPKGTALTLSGTLLANNNSYSSIYKALEAVNPESSPVTLKAQADSPPHELTEINTEPISEQENEDSDNENSQGSDCNIVNLDILDFYMASPQTKAITNDPFNSVTLSLLSGSQTKLSALDHSLQNHKLAWNLLGYPTSFGLTYNSDGKFINVTTSKASVQNLIGIASDGIKVNNGIILGGFLPESKFNPTGEEYYTVGADPRGNENKPYLYSFDISANQGSFSRSKDTFANHYTGFSNGLDITPNGQLLLGVEDGHLTGAWKSQNKPPLQIKNVTQLRDFTKKNINHFEVDNSITTNTGTTLAVAGYALPDTYKYTDVLTILQKNNTLPQEYGLTLFAVNQNAANTSSLNVISRLDFWGKDLDSLLGIQNTQVGGYKIENNYLFISYIVNNGVDLKKFYEENYAKYTQEGRNWIDPLTGLPPSAFSYKENLYDTRLAVFRIILNNNNIQL